MSRNTGSSPGPTGPHRAPHRACFSIFFSTGPRRACFSRTVPV
uniref:Uncharacterized protein n=1 Tax=Ciona intestinalis TaxID=7719 RepID=H2XXD7_CIOIN